MIDSFDPTRPKFLNEKDEARANMSRTEVLCREPKVPSPNMLTEEPHLKKDRIEREDPRFKKSNVEQR
jgi:hypothetical protein